MNPLTVALVVWTLATVVGSIVGILAMKELRRNWEAVKYARGRPYARVLHDIVLGNIYQQSSRMVMEIVCWGSILVSLFGDEATRGVLVAWLLVMYRLMHTLNSVTEYVSNQRRRRLFKGGTE